MSIQTLKTIYKYWLIKVKLFQGFFFFFFFYIYNLQFLKQNVHSHQVLIYLNGPGIPVRKPLQNREIVEEQLDVWVLGVTCASLITGRHLLMNKKDKNSRYTTIKITII